MIDTVVAICEPSQRLDDAVFQGGITVEDVDGNRRRSRLWRNPEGQGYAPRVTYWRDADKRDNGLLKIEFSVPKLVGLEPGANVSDDDLRHALLVATMFVRAQISGDLPVVGEWTAQRVDYAYNWRVGDELVMYMSLLTGLHVRDYQRQTYGLHGIKWMSASRTISAYDKSVESGQGSGVLRFEVSNHRDALRYMASRWFTCKRTVAEMCDPGRALYVFAWVFEQLGLLSTESYGSDAVLVHRLREAFGVRSIPAARHALEMISAFGPTAYKPEVGLISKWTYYSWRKKLLSKGFLLRADNELMQKQQQLSALALPLHTILTQKAIEKAHNLDKNDAGGPTNSPPTILQKKSWENLAWLLGVSVLAKKNELLLGQYLEAA